MNALPLLGRLLELPELEAMADPELAWTERERVEDMIAARLRGDTTEHWLSVLDQGDVWCAPVLTLDELVASDGFAAIEMTQTVERNGVSIRTTRSPIRVDGQVLASAKAAPVLGEDDARVRAEFPAAAVQS